MIKQPESSTAGTTSPFSGVDHFDHRFDLQEFYQNKKKVSLKEETCTLQ